jgi:hypothetical protein
MLITKQESDARGWIKDPQQLQTALAALAQRKATVTQPLAVCSTMAQPQLCEEIWLTTHPIKSTR